MAAPVAPSRAAATAGHKGGTVSPRQRAFSRPGHASAGHRLHRPPCRVPACHRHCVCVQRCDGRRSEHRLGRLRNFRETWNDPAFRKALWNTLIFTFVAQVFVLVMANILALVLSMDFHGKRFVRFLILLPWATPVALVAVGWWWILAGLYSPLDYILRELGALGPGAPWGPMRNMYWLAVPDKRPLLGGAGPRLAHLAALDGDPARRSDEHPAGCARGSECRRRRLLAPALLDSLAAARADHAGRFSLWHGFHLHRHDHRLHHDARAPTMPPRSSRTSRLSEACKRAISPGRFGGRLPLPGAGRGSGVDAPRRRAETSRSLDDDPERTRSIPVPAAPIAPSRHRPSARAARKNRWSRGPLFRGHVLRSFASCPSPG